jgi:hypothetical protein
LRFSLENKRISAVLKPDLKVAVFSYESPALTAELPDRCMAVGWCDESDAAGSELSIVAEGWSVGRAGFDVGSVGTPYTFQDTHRLYIHARRRRRPT